MSLQCLGISLRSAAGCARRSNDGVMAAGHDFLLMRLGLWGVLCGIHNDAFALSNRFFAMRSDALPCVLCQEPWRVTQPVNLKHICEKYAHNNTTRVEHRRSPSSSIQVHETIHVKAKRPQTNNSDTNNDERSPVPGDHVSTRIKLVRVLPGRAFTSVISSFSNSSSIISHHKRTSRHRTSRLSSFSNRVRSPHSF